MKKKQIGENNLLFKLNKKLGSKRMIILVCSVVFIFIALLGNYFINVLINAMKNDFSNLFTWKNLYTFNISFVKENAIIKFFYIVLLIGDIVYSAMLSYRFYTSYTDMNIGQKGTTRWTTVEEIKEQYKEIPDKGKTFPGYGGLPVARIGNKLYIDDTNTNNIILGITRSGKGEMFVVPMIDIYSRAAEKASMVVLDMKMELICRSYDSLKKRGYDVLFLNIQDPERGNIQFNPLEMITKYYIDGKRSDAELLCNSFAYSIYSGTSKSGGGDDTEFFLSNATSALSALIIAHIDDCCMQDKRENAAAELKFIQKQQAYDLLPDVQKIDAYKEWNDNKPILFTVETLDDFQYIPSDERYVYSHENLKKVTVPSIVNTFTNLARVYINPHLTKLDIYFQKRPEGDRAKAIYASIEVSGDRTKGSIFSQALTKLNIYMYENITKLTSKSTFDIESIGFGEKPVALFIGVSYYDRSKDSIVSTLISQVFQANARRAEKEPGQKCRRKIIFNLDEIGNYPAIMDFKTMLSVGLGCNMLFNLIIQDYNQMDATYKDDAKTIKSNCGNQIYIQTASLDTAKEFSGLLGKETITNVTRTGRKMELSKSFTEIYEERPLLNENELMEFMPGEVAIKRVMKRIDNHGNKVVPYPILNSIGKGTSMLMSFEYLLDSFPSGLSLFEIFSTNDTAIQEAPEFYNYNITMDKYAFLFMEEIFNSGDQEKIESLSQKDLSDYERLKEIYKYDMPLYSLPNGKVYMQFSANHGCQVKKDIILCDFIDLISQSNINLKEKADLFKLISKGGNENGY
jgi:type IV secretion system protein VirD4